VAVGFLRAVKVATFDIPPNQIYNKDEVPCCVYMTGDCTLYFRGSKSVEGADTGFIKPGYTVCLTTVVLGRMLASMNIFRGQKKPLKVNIPESQIIITASKSDCVDV
jgi:hypothetical protein